MGNTNCSDITMSKVYFSCPKFTVLLVMKGAVIVKAAPIAKAFEGQTIGALTSWARTKFGGPIMVEKITTTLRTSDETSTHQRRLPGLYRRP